MMNQLHWIWILLLCWSPCGLQAQQPGPVKERLQNMKIAFFTQELSLTTEEAQRFWPVYNEYTHELEANTRKMNQKQHEMRQAFLGSDDALIERLLDEYIEFKKTEYDISKKYHEKFKEILPIRKVARLYKAERDFKARILRELERRKQNNRNNRNR
ncbi:MAG: hypothetical protein D6730_24855 [Bacteroidetes bacterium]|nr:MAG: hypothetical protein D6730_24855 [Bacteroidota bacterium]